MAFIFKKNNQDLNVSIAEGCALIESNKKVGENKTSIKEVIENIKDNSHQEPTLKEVTPPKKTKELVPVSKPKKQVH